ncbi:MAG: hypothetical protein RL173_2135 [Fibrobacterota bacterium]|jgi:flagellar hook protein FlgE
MMRSLFSGISGLKSLQANMDIIGNNISNVNTTGYKSGRMTFQQSLNQTMNGATAPGGLGLGTGGTNPLQVGLGSNVASVDTQFSQGNLQQTGQTTDLALQGSAFFVVSKGDEQFFTRDGAFSLDAVGHLVMPGNGLVLQGFNADDDGQIPITAVREDITIPFNTSAPAKATTQIDFARNLDSASTALGTITHTSQFLAPTDGSTLATAASGADGRSLGLQVGDKLTFSAWDPTLDESVSQTLIIDDSTTLENIRTSMVGFLSTFSPGAQLVWNTDSPPTGQLELSAVTSDISRFNVKSSRPISSSRVADAFYFPTNVVVGNPASKTNSFLRPANSEDLVANVFSADGKPLGINPLTGADSGLQEGDNIDFSGAVGGTSTVASGMVYHAATTTMDDIITGIRNQLHLPQNDGTIANNETVSMNGAGTDDNIPDGSLVIRGLPETSFSLTDLSIHADDSDNTSPAPNFFNTNMGFKELQAARDTAQVNTSITAYDNKGFSHNLSVTFTKSLVPNEWFWKASVAGTESIQSGGSGKLAFGTDGTVANFTFDDQSSRLIIDPKNGAEIMQVQLNPGGPGKFAGLTQFRAANTAAATNQDGHTMGSLRNISIGADGVITGQFSNGVTRSLAQVVVADFTNAQGLMHESDSVYSQSANSGDPVFGRPGSQSTTTLQSGTLEMSNVDLAGQFTEMITTQRGYQANARVITTSDSLLQELVGLVR